MKKTTILVLCAGNIGRSPLAAVMLQDALARRLGIPAARLADEGVVVVSAGTDAPEGHPASGRGIAIAAEKGLDLSGHGACSLTASDVRRADVIYGMDRAQLDAVVALVPEAAAKTELLMRGGHEIPDPRDQSDDFFNDVAVQIEHAVAIRADEIIARLRA